VTATLRDVANAAGVHPGTASRAMNPETEHLVNSTTARRVRKAAERLGYVPNPIARSLKTNRSRTIGAVIPDLTNPLFPPIIRGFEDVLGPAGYSVLIANTDNEPAREARQVAELRARQAEGMVVATARVEDQVLEQLIAAGTPVVLVNRVGSRLAAPSVTGDDASGIRQALDHLQALGHERVAHIAGPQDTSTGVSRVRAFRSETEERGIATDDAIVAAAAFSIDAGRRAMGQLLDTCHFTAVIAGNDLIAVGAYDELRERGLRVPDDMSVVGFNDLPFVDRIAPPLTTVRLPHYEIGAEAGRLMLEALGQHADGGPKAPKSVLLPVDLVVRDSTGPCPRDGR
jgi:LacI family transcriptional regulator